ncbi:MAG: ABC transporter substrate-binding protein [Candidatus Dormibacteraeota bacterium]|uniref:ABC transporter substrate-binding protein n=1 Tax=Candidatus Dormiibacter inghamiae TaxID=3127013 RepID=A0A934KIG7_9BACT|nr:ABC transporter substrate-binding protein [Candidatus Dormibacteraeota bacterium]MBJ7606763.1 ABC transporter substrate-binding protein [Candidatus Dormibacteraeota bacterium]
MVRGRIGIIASVLVALSLAACGGSGSTGASGGKTPYIAIVSKGFSQQFWQAVKSGAESEAKKEGARITFEGPPTESDVEKQITMLTNALAKRPDAIGFAALDSRAAAPLMQQAKSANIPVIAFDSGVDSTVPVTTAATDNKAAAAEDAKHLSQLVGGKGVVGMVIHDQTSQTGTQRRDGFIDWMKTNAPGITLLPPQYSSSDLNKAADITKSIIAANQDLAGIYGSNEASAEGVAKGIQESGKKGVKAVGFDSGKAQIDAIKSGTLAGAITQNPIAIGQQVVVAAMKAIKGVQQPKFINTGYYWYDSTNINDPKIQAVLYQ